MITTPFIAFLAIALLIVSIKLLESRTKSRFFEFVPSVVIIYFLTMIAANVKLFDPVAVKSFDALKGYLLSCMIILMLIKSDIKSIYKIKTKLIVSFFFVSTSIAASFVLMWALLGGFFEHDAYKAFGALSASWIGGTANMIAVAGAIDLSGDLMGYCLITDSINYAVWLMFLLFMAPHKDRFNTWTNAVAVTTAPPIDKEHAVRLEKNLYTIVIAVLLCVAVVFAANRLPKASFVNSSFWIVVISTVLGIAGSFTALAKNNLSDKVGFWLLYFLISFIAVSSSFEDFSKAPLFIAAGAAVILIHAVLAVLYAKIFRVDLFTISVASLANIGGVASAPLLAASFSKNLISVGVIMSMLGYIIGTFAGLAVTYILAAM